MNDRDIAFFLPFFEFFLLLVGIWLAVTMLIGLLSGWFSLQKRYPDNDEPALLTLRGQWAMMGKNARMGRTLTFSACPSGLRIAIWRGFGLFQRPFLVPWDEISAESKTRFFEPVARLTFGHPDIGGLTTEAAGWQSLSAYSPAKARGNDRFEPVSKGPVGRALLLQWAILSAVMVISLSVVVSLQPPRNMPAVVIVFAVPVMFGIAQLIRFIQMRF